ncbi:MULTISPECIES: hypothetical protein [Actinotignum]|uniref:NTF2-like N-terminal transpeptidase domain-containing protein n=5 Tax=Actinotignum timonense TaxID=1870995 RepID=A0ABU5GDP8_9ACTO|nr:MULTISPECIES: hypothetical protein [Actinotignum]MDE1558953.1 hypothetical protein [Actinotignum schaalii]MDE1663353.1 hypothetical protein [Actinotignum schaalii]MDK6591113.1 hypothetical protein [Actinotignum timonense]MDK6780578.1 hypothetical protein [Actinotignum timonense]MDK8284709.1 hypothetical protein [Actinotignum timonense]
MRRRRVLFGALAVLLIALAVLAVRQFLAATYYSPAAVASRYMAALEEGRAREALDLTDPGALSGSFALLSDEVYRAVPGRPAHFQVRETSSIETETGAGNGADSGNGTGSGNAASAGTETSVRVDGVVSYNGTQEPLSLTLVRRGTTPILSPRWQVSEGALGQLRVERDADRGTEQASGGGTTPTTGSEPPTVGGGPASTPPTLTSINDVPVALAPQEPAPAFPGDYTVAAPGDSRYLTFGAGATATVRPGQTATARLSAQATPAAGERAVELVERLVESCVRGDGTTTPPAGCPATFRKDRTFGDTRKEKLSWKEKPQVSASVEGLGGTVSVRGGVLERSYEWRLLAPLSWEKRSDTARVFEGEHAVRFRVENGDVVLESESLR